MNEPSLTEARVADWLAEHPDFLVRHPALIARLEIPHQSGAASLIERQVELLRDENASLERRLRHLSGVAGENERLMRRLHGLSLRLVATDSTADLFDRLNRGLREEFRADAVQVLLDAERLEKQTLPGVLELPDPRPEWLEALLRAGETVCGRLTRDKRSAVFGEQAEAISSAALIPIDGQALLAIGSDSDERFHPDMGTLFLELLGQTLRFRLALEDPASKQQRQRA